MDPVRDLSHTMMACLLEEEVSAFSGEDVNVPKALLDVAQALRLLGNADAGTPMGAIEGHAVAVKEAASTIASAISELADAIRDSGDRHE